MPSVEMRRSTRVTVLRSGRRLWVESGEVKHRGPNRGDEWYPLIESDTHCKDQSGWLDVDSMDIDEEEKEQKQSPQKLVNRVPYSEIKLGRGERVVKNVYSRKRKRKSSQLSVEFEDLRSERREREFGLFYVRRQRRKIKGSDEERENRGVLSIVVESSCGECSLFSRLLSCLLRQMMTREEIGMKELSSFLLSSPICPVFASFGIHFLWNRPSAKRRGLCRIFGARKFAPLFSVDFSAAPLCFLQLHKTMLLRSVHLSYLCYVDFQGKNKSPDINEPLPVIKEQIDQSVSIVSTSSNKGHPKIMKAVNPSVGVGKLGSWSAQYRIGVTTRSHGLKRRSRSLRTRRARNPSHLVLLKTIGSLVSNHIAPNKKASLSSLSPTQEFRRSTRKGVPRENNVPKSSSSSSLSLNVDVESQCCSANILVVEHDKGYRIEGAEVMLDVSDSNDWVLAVKKDGSMRYRLKVQREMRSGNPNRFTHAIIWAGENGWKLEFPERKDWLLFKELYKACVERNVVPTSPVVKMIPVPGVSEVSNSWESCGASFKRPESYIRMTGDELSRALASRKAYYDMDCEDQEWLKKFNNEWEGADVISEETFELMIDVFEKASYRHPDEFNDGKEAANLCLDYASSLVAEEVYEYWINKRNQKRGPLIRVFQLNQPRRAQFITKPVLRKKRSLKRNTIQPTQCGRGKDSTVLQAIAAEQGG